MSEMQKLRMTMSAHAKTRTEYERATRRLLESTNCPLASVFAASGGTSTENSVTCEFRVSDLHPAWTPDCNSFKPGQIMYCPLLTSLMLLKNKMHSEAMQLKYIQRMNDLRFIQLHRNEFEPHVAGAVGWRELKPEDQHD